MTTQNVDNLVNGIPNYAQGFMRHNRYHVNMYTPVGTYTRVPAFAVRVPGWDVGTVSETGVIGNIKMFPFRKNWNQSLFVTFYNEVVTPATMEIEVGDNAHNLKWEFGEVYPRVLYPIELKPVEDYAPFIFSVQFVYRYFNLYANGSEIG